jgi:hypothetical protein
MKSKNEKKLERIKSVDHFRKSFKGGATPRISRKSRKGRMIRLPVLYSLADQAKLKHLLSFKYEPVKKSAIFKASGMPDPVAEASGNISSSTYRIIPIAHHEALVRQSVSVINNIIPEPAVDVAQVHAKDTKADFITDFISRILSMMKKVNWKLVGLLCRKRQRNMSKCKRMVMRMIVKKYWSTSCQKVCLTAISQKRQERTI